MKRVIGIGGVFFKCKDPQKTKAWYHKHLGIKSGDYGGTFVWRQARDGTHKGHTAWSPFPADTTYFEPGDRDFMLNYRVEDLEGLLDLLREEGVEVVGEMESYEYGKFGWIMDPDGQKVELWEPRDEIYEGMVDEEDNANYSA